MFTHKKSVTYKNLEKELDNLSGMIEDLKFPRGFLQTILYIISELFANVEEHSFAKKVSFNIKIDKKNVEIEITDDGIGFRKSYLKKDIYPKDDFSAIEFALSGLSTKGSQERGFGLYSIKKLIGAMKGRLIIKTGLAEATVEKNRITFRKLEKKKAGAYIGLTSSVKTVDLYKII